MRLRRFAPWTVYVLFYGTLIFAAVVGVLHLPWTRAMITGAIEDALSSGSQSATVRGLSGIIPFDMRLAQFDLADRDGVWLEVENAVFDLKLRDLARFALTIQEVGAERVTLHRAPLASSEPPPPSEPAGPPAIPELPGWLPAVGVERLFVGRLELGEPLLGEALAVAIEASAGTGPEGEAINTALTIDGLEATQITATLGTRFGLVGPTLSAQFEVTETGGLIARLANMPELGDVALSLTADGPLSAWRADLDLTAKNLISADLGLDLAYGTTPEIALEGHLVPEGAGLPPEFSDLLEGGVDLRLSATQTGPQAYELSALTIESAVAEISGQAALDEVAERFDLKLDVSIDDLARLSDLAGTPLDGSVQLNVTNNGDLADPALNITLQGRDLAADTNSLSSLDAEIDLLLLAPLIGPFAGLDAKGRVTADGFLAGETAFFPHEPVVLAFDASAPAGQAMVLRQVGLTATGLQVTITGEVDPSAGQGTIELKGDIEDLATLLDALAVDAADTTGGLELRADINLADTFQSIAGDVRIDGNGLGNLPGGADALVGATPALNTSIQANLSEMALLETFELTLAALSINGSASAGLGADKTLAGEIALAMPELAALEPIIQQPIAGTADIKLALAGTIDAPRADLAAIIGQVELAGQRFDEISLSAKGADLIEAPNGNVDLRARQPQGSLALASDYAMSDQQLQLANLLLTGPSTEIGGNLEVDLANTLIGGRLEGGVQDFAALRPWHGQDLRGRLSLSADLSRADGLQRAAVDIDLPELSGEFGEIRQLTVDARVDDALGDAGIDASIRLGGFSQENVEIDQARIDAAGQLSNLAVDISAAGEQANEPFSLDSQARLDIAGTAQTIQLDRLEARAAGQDISLREPATIVIDAGAINIDRLDLAVGEAVIQGQLDWGEGRVDGGLALETLPLPMLAAFGAPGFGGEIGAELKLQGPTNAPVIDLLVDIADLRPDDDGHPGGSGVDAQLQAGLAEAGAQAKVEIGGLSQAPGIISVKLPAKLSLEPFSFEMPAPAPLTGEIKGVIDLTRLAALAALDGQTIQGQLDTDITIGGTLAQPTIEGQSELRDGLVEDSLSGLSLKFMRAKLVKSPDGLALEGFEARDGDGGKLFADGNFNLRADDGFPFEIKVTSDDMRVLSNDIGRVYVTTDLDITGDSSEGSVAGTITVTRAEIAIPSGGGIDPVELDVTAVGDNAPPEEEEEAETPTGDDGSEYVMDIDVVVDLPARTFVRGRGLDTEWGGKLEIAGTSNAPDVTGLIEYRRGFLDFLDRRFDISEGEIRFVGGNPPIPEIDVSANARGSQIVAIITITGQATDPNFELSSEPALPTDEILSDLLFERDSASITAGQAVRLAAAVQTLEGGGFDVMGQLREVIGVDTIDVGGDNPDDASASVGKYIADGVFLEFERGLSTGTNRARVEVELTPNISVNTEMTDDSQTSIGLEWRWDY